MTEDTFLDFYESILKLAKPFEEKNTIVKIESDLQTRIIKIYGEKIDSVTQAKASLEEVLELAYATAEHHPYWNLIYNSSQISKLALEKWYANLSKEDLDEISWCLDELKNTCTKLKEKT